MRVSRRRVGGLGQKCPIWRGWAASGALSFPATRGETPTVSEAVAVGVCGRAEADGQLTASFSRSRSEGQGGALSAGTFSAPGFVSGALPFPVPVLASAELPFPVPMPFLVPLLVLLAVPLL